MWSQQIASLSLLSLGLLTHVAANPLPNALALAEAVPQPCPIDCGSICCTFAQHCLSTSTCGEGPALDEEVLFTSTFLITRTEAAVITSLVVFTSGVPDIATGTAGVTTVVGTSGASVVPAYPTLRASGTTFLVPNPSGSSGFNGGGIIGGGATTDLVGAVGGLTPAQIGGIVGGILGAFFLIALILICCCMRRGISGVTGWVNPRKETVHSGSSAHHGHSGAAAAGGGLLGYFLGRKSGSHHPSGHHVVAGGSSGAAKKTGMAALLGGAAAGLTSIFASRRKGHMEKYSTTDISSGYYTSDITSSTTYTSESTSDSSSSSSSSSESGHPHHVRR